MEKDKLDLIRGIGEEKIISAECIENCLEFIRTIMYKGKANETYLQTRVRLYDEQQSKSKTTMTIPPDVDSCTQHILRSHLQVFNWLNCDKSIIHHLNPFENGWKLSENKEVLPVWFTGPQFPPSVTKRKIKKKKLIDGYEADYE